MLTNLGIPKLISPWSRRKIPVPASFCFAKVTIMSSQLTHIYCVQLKTALQLLLYDCNIVFWKRCSFTSLSGCSLWCCPLLLHLLWSMIVSHYLHVRILPLGYIRVLFFFISSLQGVWKLGDAKHIALRDIVNIVSCLLIVLSYPSSPYKVGNRCSDLLM